MCYVHKPGDSLIIKEPTFIITYYITGSWVWSKLKWDIFVSV